MASKKKGARKKGGKPGKKRASNLSRSRSNAAFRAARPVVAGVLERAAVEDPIRLLLSPTLEPEEPREEGAGSAGDRPLIELPYGLGGEDREQPEDQPDGEVDEERGPEGELLDRRPLDILIEFAQPVLPPSSLENEEEYMNAINFAAAVWDVCQLGRADGGELLGRIVDRIGEGTGGSADLRALGEHLFERWFGGFGGNRFLLGPVTLIRDELGAALHVEAMRLRVGEVARGRWLV